MQETSRVSETEAQSYVESHNTMSEQRPHGEIPSDAEVFKRYEALTPRKNYGILSLISAPPSFQRRYKDALTNGDLNGFITDTLEADPEYEKIYYVRAKHPDQLPSQSAKDIHSNHSPGVLNRIGGNLTEFERSLSDVDLPDTYKDLYREVIKNDEFFLSIPETVGTKDFTQAQMTPSEWGSFIDLEKSTETGIIHLAFEDIAEQTIVNSRSVQESSFTSVKDALLTWNLTEEDKEKLKFDAIEDDASTIDAFRIATMFEILAGRIGLLEDG